MTRRASASVFKVSWIGLSGSAFKEPAVSEILFHNGIQIFKKCHGIYPPNMFDEGENFFRCRVYEKADMDRFSDFGNKKSH